MQADLDPLCIRLTCADDASGFGHEISEVCPEALAIGAINRGGHAV
jgi:hypothetical protein